MKNEQPQVNEERADPGNASVGNYSSAIEFDSVIVNADRAAPSIENLYPEILKNLPVPCYALDESGFITFFNEEAARLWGRRPEIGKEQWSGAFRTLTPEGKDLPGSLSAVASALRERRSVQAVESVIERPDGSRRVVADHADPFFDADGAFLGVIDIQRDVTDQRAIQEALRRSETLFRDMADHAPAMVWVTDPEGNCTYLNKTWYTFTGQTEETGLGSGWMNAIHPEDREMILVPCAAAKARREGYRLEYRLKHADGEYRRVFVVATPRFGADREFLGYIGSVLDITAQRQADETAQSTAQRLQLATEATALGTWDFFPASGSLIWDSRCKELFGLPPDAAVDYDVFLAGLHPEDRERSDQAVQRALNPGGDGTFDIEYRTVGIVDREERWIRANGRAFFDGGMAGRFVGTVQDITDRRKADKALQHLAAIVESSDDAIVSKDLNGTIMSWNWGAENVFGYTAEEMIGKPILTIIPADRHDEEREILRRIRQGDRVEHYETIRQRKDGTKIDVSLTISPLRDKTGVIIGASKIARDVTERKRTERELERAKEVAEAASRSKDRFLAVLSHELRTPLTPVLMTAALRERDPDSSAAVRADMAMIRRNVELETKLIDDLLDLSRITSGKLSLRLESLDLNTAVNQVCDICRAQIQEKGITLNIDSDPASPTVSADASRLQQVLWNVVKNAAKFTPEGGRIDVSTAPAGENRVRVQVRDSGVGIAPEMIAKIFDAFEQGDARVTREFGGLGLGLAISKALVELHHGTIGIESPGVGQGSTVTVELPAAPSGSENASSVSDTTGKDCPSQRLRLLVVEDHADTALLLKRLLEAGGYSVETAGSVAEATEAMERDFFQIMVSDLGLPDGTGCELMRQLREKYPLKGIAMSGYGMDKDVRESIEAGFSEHLVKPVDIASLERAIFKLASEV